MPLYVHMSTDMLIPFFPTREVNSERILPSRANSTDALCVVSLVLLLRTEQDDIEGINQ
jgi:hypothetical protein